MLRDGVPVYCMGTGRDEWPDDVDGREVVVQGTLVETDEFAARATPGGEQSAGTDGAVMVLRGCALMADAR